MAIGLSGLLWFKASALSSIGLGGAVVVLSSVVFALTFLPALLGMLGPRVNALSVGGLVGRISGRVRGGTVPVARRSRWERIALGVMRRPFAVLVPVLIALFIAGSPFLPAPAGRPRRELSSRRACPAATRGSPS